MSTGLSQSGATPQGTAYAVAQRARANAEQTRAAADRMRAETPQALAPANKLVETPAQIRDQVMAERGVDRLQLMRLGAQARLEAEISIAAEAAERARQAKIHTTSNFLDLRV